MRAVIFREHSPDLDVFEFVDDMPVPEIGPDDVLLKVHYSALNRLDDFVRRGWKGLHLDMPHIPGSDFAGEIAAVGSNVQRLGNRPACDRATRRCSAASVRYCIRGDHHLCERFAMIGEHVRGACAEYHVRVRPQSHRRPRWL